MWLRSQAQEATLDNAFDGPLPSPPPTPALGPFSSWYQVPRTSVAPAQEDTVHPVLLSLPSYVHFSSIGFECVLKLWNLS